MVKEFGYDQNGDILYDLDFLDDLDYISIAPNTVSYLLYRIIENVDKKELKNKHDLNGYIDLQKL